MWKLSRLIAVGAVLVLAVLALPVLAGTLSTFTGAAGTNPIAFPPDMSDVNTVINGVNANAALAGGGTSAPPSSVLGTVSTTSASLGNGNPTTVALQVVNGAVWTTVTGSATCKEAGAGICLGIFDQNGVLRWLSGN